MPTLNLITARQARAARAVLRLSVRGLAAESGVSDSSIRRIEDGASVTLDLSARLQEFYEDQGLGFWFTGDQEAVTWRVE